VFIFFPSTKPASRSASCVSVPLRPSLIETHHQQRRAANPHQGRTRQRRYSPLGGSSASACRCACSAVSNYRPAMSCRSECFPSALRMRLDKCCDYGSLCAFNCGCQCSNRWTRFSSAPAALAAGWTNASAKAVGGLAFDPKRFICAGR
jgi:hypothetical protein